MKGEVAVLFFVVLFMSSFVVAESNSEINLTFSISDGAESDGDSFLEMYWDYIVIALILLVIVILWLRRRGSSGSRGKKRKKK